MMLGPTCTCTRETALLAFASTGHARMCWAGRVRTEGCGVWAWALLLAVRSVARGSWQHQDVAQFLGLDGLQFQAREALHRLGGEACSPSCIAEILGMDEGILTHAIGTCQACCPGRGAPTAWCGEAKGWVDALDARWRLGEAL